MFQDVQISNLKEVVAKHFKDQTADTKVEEENGKAVVDMVRDQTKVHDRKANRDKVDTEIKFE